MEMVIKLIIANESTSLHCVTHSNLNYLRSFIPTKGDPPPECTELDSGLGNLHDALYSALFGSLH